MDPDIKKKWVEALRSGRYIQGTKALCSIDEEEGIALWCCLGVLASVLGFPARVIGDEMRYEFDFGGFQSMLWLPDNVLDQAVQTKLESMNDDNIPFDAIADHIEGLHF